ncbi:MAG TPA: [FeFe] hydrogenase H-cluster radical SAM maturase HydE [Spirochaetota bacterium]|nr:[FeFe] hydrogenase H-cluster radical SAM maturase HydE [Spirochaetota bacterium]HPI90638.1 [FeFe] hydrogenase H-cluster radical SAM maturase HydE [Spirochaetota bacterium]HPR49180.1 [FeFe] hydrogenase H-cluster radical SAM maturase HydE [Spirochaetota bacterium]
MFTIDAIITSLKSKDPETLKKLMQAADSIRRDEVGDTIHVRALLNISNRCARSCLYCGLRAPNRKLARYRMAPEEIIASAELAEKTGYRTILMQSGEDPWYTDDMVADIIRKISERCTMDIALSLGERPARTLERWRECGAQRYLLKHETSDEILYRKLHPDLDYENRINTLITLKSLGYQTGSGIMVGLPGQTFESVAKDILLFKDLDIDMIGCGPYVHNPDTPLQPQSDDHQEVLPTEEMLLKITSLNRIITRDTMIPATTATETLFAEGGRLNAFEAGANVVMFDITPEKYRSRYQIYPSDKTADGIRDYPSLVSALHQESKRPVATDPGRRTKKEGQPLR